MTKLVVLILDAQNLSIAWCMALQHTASVKSHMQVYQDIAHTYTDVHMCIHLCVPLYFELHTKQFIGTCRSLVGITC